MSNQNDLSKPLKTWSHLAAAKRKPSEYEIVSTNLLWSTDDPMPWSLSPEIPMNKWYLKYREGSPLQHDDWDAFRDPDELIYRTYNVIQDGQETYVDGLIADHDKNEHDKGMSKPWLETLARLYTPGRYLYHGAQMASAYLVQIVPASTIENCAMFQAADQLRWVSRAAYRTKELSINQPDCGFGVGERAAWEDDEAWQGFRELMERTLATYDWGEHFVALNVITKPAIDEACLHQLGTAARRNGDTLLAFLIDAQLLDSERSRRWTKALVNFACQNEANKKVLGDWVAKWAPLGDKAIDAYCAALPDSPGGAEAAKAAAREFRSSLDLT